MQRNCSDTFKNYLVLFVLFKYTVHLLKAKLQVGFAGFLRKVMGHLRSDIGGDPVTSTLGSSLPD